MDSLWGPNNVDRFSNCENRETVHYNSKFYEYASETVNFCTHTLALENQLACSTYLFSEQSYFHACTSHGSLIVTSWTGSVFGPVILGKDFR